MRSLLCSVRLYKSAFPTYSFGITIKNQYLHHNLGYKKIQVICQVYFSSSNVSVDTTVILKDYNHGHNILRLFDTLPSFLFTTSETKHDY